jgi:uncharacterized protein
MGRTPAPPPQRKLVDGYGAGGFKVAGERIAGSLLITSTAAMAWDIAAPQDVTVAALEPLLAAEAGLEILLLGTGARMAPPMPAVRAALKARGVALEMMTTGAACRTYNVLVAEGRRVAAALIAV